MSKHTPAPWVFMDGDDIFYGEIRTSEDFTMIAVMPDGDDRPEDFRLIAAAPDLLEVAKAMRTQVDSMLYVAELQNGKLEMSPMVKATFEKCVQMANEAITKAEGVSQ